MILKIVYDYTIEPFGSDPLVDVAHEALTMFSTVFGAGIWLPDFIPPCKSLLLSPLHPPPSTYTLSTHTNTHP